MPVSTKAAVPDKDDTSEEEPQSSGEEEDLPGFVPVSGGKEPTEAELAALAESLGNCGQGHLLAYLDELSPAQKASLLC